MAAAYAASIFTTSLQAAHICPKTRKIHNTILASSFRGRPLTLPNFTTHPPKVRLLVPLARRHYLVEKVTAAQLHKLLDGERKASVVVDFYATWCGPCIQLAQDLELLAVEFGRTVKFVKVDTDHEYELANKMQIRGLPTILFVSKDGEKNAIRTEGLLPLDVMRSIIENEL